MSGNVWLTDLADVLRAAGVDVVEVPGWRTRGWRGGSTPSGGLLTRPRGGLVHHTATSASLPGDYPSLGIVRDGRSDVPGPLSQLGLGRSGRWYVIAAGRANHSGAVDLLGYSNGYAIGVEAEHPGTTTRWDRAMYDSYVRGCAALGEHYGIVWRGHKEAAVPHGRKIDPTFDMTTFRRDVVNYPTGKDGFAMATIDELREVVREVVRAEVAEAVWKHPFQPVDSLEIPGESAGMRLRAIRMHAKNADKSIRIGREGVQSDGVLTGIVRRTPGNIRAALRDLDLTAEVEVPAAEVAEAIVDALPADQAEAIVDEIVRRLSGATVTATGEAE